MVDGLDGLGHDAVIGSNDQNGDVSHVGAAGTHGGECLMARSIEEGDEAVVDLDLIGADGLRDAAGLACGDVGLADGVEDTGLAVVNVAHDADDRGTGDEVFLCVLLLREQALFDGDMDFLLDLGVELLGQKRSGIEVDDVVDGVHLAHLHELGDDLACLLLQAGGQLADGDLIGDKDFQLCVAGLFQLDALQTLELGLALALLELLALALAALGELLLVALRGGLAAVFGVLGGGQIVVAGIEAVHVHIDSAGIHRHLIVLAADGDGLCGGSCGLCAGLTGQIPQRDGLLLPLLVLLGLLAVVVLGGGLCLRLCRLGLFLALGLRLLLRLRLCLLLGRLRLGLGGLGAVQELVEVLDAVVLAELLQQVVQLVLLQSGAVLLAGAAHGVQFIEDLLGRDAQVLCKIAHFIFYDHSLISSSV